ncbi:MAG: AAA family ATPase [Roseburia sp.]|nr:AAA family ATPase [Roseburia sp.]
MIGICSKCGNHEWDKKVENNEIICPKCGNRWKFKKLPIFFLTGCSGIGKTTTGIELQKITSDYVILDADMFYNIMNPQNEYENYHMIAQIFNLAKNINQSGKMTVWTMAGNIDKLYQTYGSKYFSEINVLALTATSEEIRRRMQDGRKIEDEGWIQGSIDYNEYFRTHDSLGDTKFEYLDCTNNTPEMVAEKVLKWLNLCCNK